MANPALKKPRVGISACLLGQPVRHDGSDKRHEWVTERLGRFVTFVPICPEVEMGLGVPRDTLRLTGKAAAPRLVKVKNGEDLTERANATAERLLAKDLDIDAYILKKESPSCGLARVKVYPRPDTAPARDGVGFFAAKLVARYPLIPVIEEGRLFDPLQREEFAIQLFAIHRLRSLDPTVAELQFFHQNYKFLLLSHDPALAARLGKIAANPKRLRARELVGLYEESFIEAMRKSATPGKRVNALQHMLGFLSEKIGAAETNQVLEAIEDYRKGEIPFIVPLMLLKHLARKHQVAYLEAQATFQPYPKDLKCGDI